nr:hypothetical protein [Tanacetum cinerariifolium]
FTLHIEQFWTTAKMENVNGEAQIQALVDKNKVVITEASIRRDLRFKYEGGVDFLSNEVIFEQLTLMGSTMASAIIYLAINQKFNFSKYIFDNMVKHLNGGVKFLMYPRFVQVFLDNQVEGMDRHNAIFFISSHTKKVFAYMKREGKDFSRKVRPLFQSMMVQAPEDMGESSDIPTNPHHTPIVTQPSSSQSLKKQKPRSKLRKEIEVPSPSSEIPNKEGVPTTSNDPLPTCEDRMQLNELMILCTNLQKTGLKRLKKVGSSSRIESSTVASLSNQKEASKQRRMIDNIDQDVEITLVDETQGMMNEKYMFGVNDLDGNEVVVDVLASEKVEQSVKIVEKEGSTADLVTTAGEVTTAAQMQAELEEEERIARLKEEETNIALVAEWDNIQAMMDADCKLATRLQEKERGELSIEEKSSAKAVEGSEKAEDGGSKRAENNLEQEDAKRQMIEEDNESAELKRCLKIIPEDNDDVTIKATPISSKSPTIVNYKIYKEGKKSFFQNHQSRWLLLSLTKVNAASSKFTTANRVTNAGWIKTEID